MNDFSISPDSHLYWQSASWHAIKINATLVNTWVVMAVLTLGSWWLTRRLRISERIPRWQACLEVLITGIRRQIRDVSGESDLRYLPFIGTLFLFIAVANLLSVIPGFRPPTGSLSTTAALASCVFVAVPLYGIASRGLLDYLRQYTRPTFFMLPFNIVGELSRTLALAVRLYGNMMSGSVIAAILLGFVPLFVPVLMQLFGLLTGMIQAYIFAVLAMVYIASATRIQQQQRNTDSSSTPSASPETSASQETSHG